MITSGREKLFRAKTNRMQTSPPRDVEALAKLQARTKYNPSEVAKSESLYLQSRLRKLSLLQIGFDCCGIKINKLLWQIEIDKLLWQIKINKLLWQTVEEPVVHHLARCPRPHFTQRWIIISNIIVIVIMNIIIYAGVPSSLEPHLPLPSQHSLLQLTH